MTPVGGGFRPPPTLADKAHPAASALALVELKQDGTYDRLVSAYLA